MAFVGGHGRCLRPWRVADVAGGGGSDHRLFSWLGNGGQPRCRGIGGGGGWPWQARLRQGSSRGAGRVHLLALGPTEGMRLRSRGESGLWGCRSGSEPG
ncbi:hypothetical protein NL676_023990 [Syzygium grande]|nr:hypothetical protein NL676_023990 [Syzygium grande]